MTRPPPPAFRYRIPPPPPFNPNPRGGQRTWPADPRIDRWLERRCTLEPQANAFSSDLRRSWLAWCRLRGLDPGHRLHVGQQLGLRGFPYSSYGKNERGVRHGLRLTEPTMTDKT